MTEPAKYRLAASVVVQDPDGRILLAREADPRVHGKINLPGGHVDPGEIVSDCALRELQKETGLPTILSGLLGVYINSGGVNVVSAGKADTTHTIPGEDIFECCWMLPEEIRNLPDVGILRPGKMGIIVSDSQSGRILPLDVIRALEPEEWENESAAHTSAADHREAPDGVAEGQLRVPHVLQSFRSGLHPRPDISSLRRPL